MIYNIFQSYLTFGLILFYLGMRYGCNSTSYFGYRSIELPFRAVKYVYYCSDSNNTTLEGTLICSIILLGVNTDC